jgi:hypothetical protein
VFACGAYFFGSRIESLTGPAGVIVLVLAAAGFIWLVMLMREHEARWIEAAERAFPGQISPAKIKRTTESGPRPRR